MNDKVLCALVIIGVILLVFMAYIANVPPLGQKIGNPDRLAATPYMYYTIIINPAPESIGLRRV